MFWGPGAIENLNLWGIEGRQSIEYPCLRDKIWGANCFGVWSISHHDTSVTLCVEIDLALPSQICVAGIVHLYTCGGRVLTQVDHSVFLRLRVVEPTRCDRTRS